MMSARADASREHLSGQDFFAPGRSAIMIDGNSIQYALRSLNAEIDYRRLRDLFVADRRLVRALYYALVTRDDEEFGLRRLLDWLDYNGYVVREKYGRAFVAANGHRSLRGHLSLEIAVDALELAPLIDHLILFSGDGDLAALVEAVQRKGVRVTAVSTLMTRPPMIARELRRQVDRFIDLRELRPFIGRDG
jgi:uncharacterized LabA/DUF88 family protein